jgi:hypothetical protein
MARAIEVTVSLETSPTPRLRIEPASIELRDGDWVYWKFEDLPEGQFGFISFAPPLPRLGPFSSLRSCSTATDKFFLGKGNKGPAHGGDYEYLALFLDPESDAPFASGTGRIDNLATREDAAREVADIVVTYSQVNNPDGSVERILDVAPDPVALNTGDTAIWHFENLPAEAFACFKFTLDPARVPSMREEAFGPFTFFEARNGDDPGAVQASGAGFGMAIPRDERGQAPTFTYHVEVRDWNGERLASHDPAIDNLGPPIPPTL